MPDCTYKEVNRQTQHHLNKGEYTMNEKNNMELNNVKETEEKQMQDAELEKVSGGHFHYKGAGVNKEPTSDVKSHGSGASGSW